MVILLFFVGAIIAMNSRTSTIWGGLRMLLAGGIAASITFGIGSLVNMGVNW